MITERDKDIISYLREKGAKDADELRLLFFPNLSRQWADKRLKDLTDRGHLKRKRGVDDRCYIYYVD